MMRNDFVAFIISHGRPDNIKTIDTIRKRGYTGKIRIVIDNTDKKADEYYKRYGSEVLMFDKVEIAKTTDQGDNFNNLRTTTHARNAVFDLAEQEGFKYFVVLDDDYTNFSWRFNDKFEFTHVQMGKSLDKIFNIILDFFINTNCYSVALSQGGDYIGGAGSGICLGKGIVTMKRKCMNSFFCSTDRRFNFFSRLNEDVNTYLVLGMRGHIFLTENQVMLNQALTQASTGGMTEAYLDFGTYVKSFYSVMYMPSAVKVKLMGVSNRRLHHCISNRHAFPMILCETLKKRA